MLFPTIDFALFFAVVLPVSWILAPPSRRWCYFILAASYVFYGWWDWRFVWLLAASTLLNQVGGTLLARFDTPALRNGSSPQGRRWRASLVKPSARETPRASSGARRLVLVAVVAGNLGVLGYFKYYGFLVTSVANTLDGIGVEPNMPLLQVILPVGISFFTFQALSYVVDIYRREIQPTGLLDFAVYLSFFPHLVAGPIVRAREFLPQLRASADPRRVDGGRAFALIVSGLFKKVVIANYLATNLVDDVFANPGGHSAAEILFGIYGYAVQIYADFSGYTDIAIGLALLLGFRFPANFDRPYTARSLQDFWRRWHMTLSRWLRDYLYIPLGGSRGSERATTRNLMLTMLLGGLWHGAAWTFVVWGGIHGVGLAYERVVERRRGSLDAGTAQGDAALIDAATAPAPVDTGMTGSAAVGTLAVVEPRAPRAKATARWREASPPWVRLVGRWALTFHIVCLAWVFFRADSFGTALTMLGRLVTAWGPAPAVTPALVAVIVGAIAAQFIPRDVGGRVQLILSRMRPLPLGLTLAATLLVIDALGPEGVAPFIYFQF